MPNFPINLGPEVDGVRRVSSAAFGDRGLQPSVDRAKLRDNKPENAKADPTDGVVSLLAAEVRTVKLRSNSESSRTVNVVSDPIENNPSHALIITEPTPLDPTKNTDKAQFKKLKKALANLAKWEIHPSS